MNNIPLGGFHLFWDQVHIKTAQQQLCEENPKPDLYQHQPH